MEYKDLPGIERISNSLDSLSPYVGKIRPELVDRIIEKYVDNKGTIYDPFSGSGTVLLEGWIKGYNVIGTDLNEYAVALAKGKTNPYESQTIAIQKLESYKKNVEITFGDIHISLSNGADPVLVSKTLSLLRSYS